MGSRQYYVAVFGDPGDPQKKDLVESGRYEPDARYAPRPKPGDLILLYCTEQHRKFPKQVPGIGQVTTVDDEAVVSYRWIPLDEPIPKTVIDQTFEANDTRSFQNIRFSTKWLFEISERSFMRTVRDQMPNAAT